MGGWPRPRDPETAFLGRRHPHLGRCPSWRAQGLLQGPPWGSWPCAMLSALQGRRLTPGGAILQMRVADRPAPAVDRAAGPRGLSLLVQQVLGKPLDNTQQLSNWDRRPLGDEQLVYAGGCPLSCPAPPHPPHWSLRLTLPTLAADAYCLLEVYWALCREPARFHLPGALPWSLGLGCSERRGTQEPPLQKASASPRQVGEARPFIRVLMGRTTLLKTGASQSWRPGVGVGETLCPEGRKAGRG